MGSDFSSDERTFLQFWKALPSNNETSQVFEKMSQLVDDPTAISQFWRDMLERMKKYAFNKQASLQRLANYFAVTANSQIAESIGQFYIELAKAEKARFWFVQAIKLNPQLQEPYFHLAESFKAEGNYEQMLEILLKCKKEIKDNVVVTKKISKLCEEVGQYKKSLTFYKKLIELSPETIVSYISYIQCATSNKYDIEVDDCWIYLAKVMLMLKPKTIVIAYYLRGLILRKQNRIFQAIELFKKSINTNKDFIWAYKQLGLTYWQINHPQFLQPFHRYLSIHPGQLSMMAVIGIYQYHIGNYEKCSETMQSMISQYNALSSPTFQPFVMRYLALSGQYQAMDKYTLQHLLRNLKEDQPILQQAVICSSLSGDSNGVIIYLRMLISRKYTFNQTKFKIRLALEYIKIEEKQKAENIIFEIEQLLDTMTRDQTAYFLVLLVEAKMYKKAFQIFEKKIKYSEDKLQNTSQIYMAYSLSLACFELGNNEMANVFSSMHERVGNEWGNPIFSVFLFVKAQLRIGNKIKAQKYYKMLEKKLEETKIKGFHCQKKKYQREMIQLRFAYQKLFQNLVTINE